MNNSRTASEFAKLLPKMLENGESITVLPGGKSMLPTIRTGDAVTLSRPDNLKRYDIVLYIRKDGKAVLHRIVSKASDGSYIMSGDAQLVREHGICAQNIVAKVTAYTKNGKTVKTDSVRYKAETAKVIMGKFLTRVKNKIKRILKKGK